MVEHRVLVTGSVRFSYGVAGSGPAVVLVPGSGGWQLTFHHLVPRLAATHTVCAVDPPGQGDTRVTDPAFGFDTDAVAGALERFIVAAGLERAAIVGHSWGCGFALRLAELYPARADRLALLAPAGVVTRDVWEFRALRLPVVGEVAVRFTTAASVRHMLRKSFTKPERLPPPELIGQAAARLRSGPEAAARRRDLLAVERRVNWKSTEQQLSAMQCPVLILWGTGDRYLPVNLLKRFRSRLPDVGTHVISGAGHSVHDDAPEEVHPRMLAFLAGGRSDEREP